MPLPFLLYLLPHKDSRFGASSDMDLLNAAAFQRMFEGK